MADNSAQDPLSNLEFEKAKVEAEAELERRSLTPLCPLSANELRIYEWRGIKCGWRQSVRFGNVEHLVDILLPTLFPWQPARIAFIPNKCLIWPHVEPDGVLCLARPNTEFDPQDPAGILRCMLGSAAELVSDSIDGINHEDFQEEIMSYWHYAAERYRAGRNNINIISLIEPALPSRAVKICRFSSDYVISDGEKFLRNWMSNRYGREPRDFNVEDALLVWLKSPPMPKMYPVTGGSLYDLLGVASSGSSDKILDVLATGSDELVIAFGMETVNGPALTGAVVTNRGNPVCELFASSEDDFPNNESSLGTNSLVPFRDADVRMENVLRADPSWIHGRDRDPCSGELRTKKVAVVGCGSLGGAVAVHLAQAGVGNLILIDYDGVSWPNIGRHVLGSSSVGYNKTDALAYKLRNDFPHVGVVPCSAGVEVIFDSHAHLLEGVDLVVSVAANWCADLRVDRWQQVNRPSVPALYGWLEGHACVGHAVLIGGPPDSIRFGFDRTGEPNFRVTKKVPALQEPGCGGMFQPYGPVELAMVNGVIAGLALEALLKEATMPCHRVWVNPDRLEALGDRWSPGVPDNSKPPSGKGFVFERPWPRVGPGMNEATDV